MMLLGQLFVFGEPPGHCCRHPAHGAARGHVKLAPKPVPGPGCFPLDGQSNERLAIIAAGQALGGRVTHRTAPGARGFRTIEEKHLGAVTPCHEVVNCAWVVDANLPGHRAMLLLSAVPQKN